MFKMLMTDTLQLIKSHSDITWDIQKALDFVHYYGGKVDREDIEKSDLCEIYTADGLKITIMND